MMLEHELSILFSPWSEFFYPVMELYPFLPSPIALVNLLHQLGSQSYHANKTCNLMVNKLLLSMRFIRQRLIGYVSISADLIDGDEWHF